MKEEMKMKIIALGILSMFLLTSLIAGTGASEKTTNSSTADLQVELIGITGPYEGYGGLIAKVTNIGEMNAYGSSGGITLTLAKKGPLGLLPIAWKRTGANTVWKLQWTILESGEYLAPGESIYAGVYRPMGGFPIQVFTYAVSPAIGETLQDLSNNKDTQRTFTKLTGSMYFI